MSKRKTPSTPGERDAIDIDAQLFAPERLERLDLESIETGLRALLARYPDAPIAAMKPDGVCVPVPALDGGRDHPVVQARSGLDLVAGPDRLRVLASWDAMLARGAGRCVAHPAEEPGEPVTVYFFDMREAHDAIVAVFVPADLGDSPSVSVARVAPAQSKPRFAKVVKDQLSMITEIDDALTQILGWSPEEMTGRRSIEFIHPDDHALAIDNWMEMLSAPGLARRVRLRHRHRDGAWVWFEVTNHNYLDDPERACVFCELVDITDEMAAAEEVRARKELLDRIAEAIPMGLLQIDAAGDVVYTNDRLHEILGVQRAPSASEQLASLLDEDRERLLSALADLLARGRAADLEVRLRSAGERMLRLCAINLRALSDGEGATAGAIACIADITDSARMREELTRRATYDELTACYNRASITRMLESTVDRDAAGCCAVMFVDVDRFKHVNDEFGHAAGDELLQVLAERLRRAVRSHDHVGRLGGDEFLVVCPDVDSRALAASLAQRVRNLLGEPVALAAGALVPQVSVGVAWSACGATSARELIARADGAMYEEKHERAAPRAAL
jgi:diguanylate cyclase (GGDEF)-like protein/PAS domain S-box-containing protein